MAEGLAKGTGVGHFSGRCINSGTSMSTRISTGSSLLIGGIPRRLEEGLEEDCY